MVNDAHTFGIDPAAGHPERALALGYVPAVAHEAVVAAFALDATLARLALGTRDAMVAQLRITWWYEALNGLGADAPAQPILRALAAGGADGAALAGMVDGWEQLLDAPGEQELRAFGAARARLFVEAARLAGATDAVAEAGAGWALADLAATSSNPALARAAAGMAAPLLDRAAGQRYGGPARFLGALVHVARADLAQRHVPGSPVRVARLAWHRLTGR